jgi:hypothetical protein
MELATGSVIQHDRYGRGIVAKVNLTSYEIYFETKGRMEISKQNSDYTIEEAIESESTQSGLSLKQIEEAIFFVLEKNGMIIPEIPIGEKWNGGSLILQPSNPDLKAKDIPIEVFFHKIVMLRDNIRVMEQKINSHPGLSDEDKVQMQQYITKMYGSLTTFNILFSDKEHFFKGAGK